VPFNKKIGEQMPDRDENNKLYPKLSELYYWDFRDNKDQGPFEWTYYIQVSDLDYYITAEGMSVDYKGGGSVHTNVVPYSLFPGSEYGLKDEELIQLLKLPVEGKFYSRDEISKLYEQYKKDTDDDCDC
jgi:hypothetical protein